MFFASNLLSLSPEGSLVPVADGEGGPPGGSRGFSFVELLQAEEGGTVPAALPLPFPLPAAGNASPPGLAGGGRDLPGADPSVLRLSAGPTPVASSVAGLDPQPGAGPREVVSPPAPGFPPAPGVAPAAPAALAPPLDEAVALAVEAQSIEQAEAFLAGGEARAPAPPLSTAPVTADAGPVASPAPTGAGAGVGLAEALGGGSEPPPIDTRQHGWEESLGQRVQWLVGQRVQSAAIELYPESLGQVDVHIELEADAVRVNFAAAEGAAREALEEALPRLRAMLAAAGLELGNATVSDGRAQDDAAGRQRSGPGGDGADRVDDAAPAQRLRGDGLLDVYA